jgi:GNAT superfamily N-acetyltransferase
MWVIHPSSLPQDISERLQKRGLIDVEPIPGMARTLDDLEDVPPVPDGIEIRKVESDSDASAFIQFAVWRWNVPEQYEVTYRSIIQNFHIGKFGSRYHMWQAWKDDRPVSKAAMYAGSKSAGIYAVVTKPEAQRLGLARVLTLTALHEARSHGIRIAVLHSTPMAEKLYQSIGFETLAEFRLFASDEVYV